MKKILFFDTETTGLPRYYNAPPEDTDNWPRLVQLAWLVRSNNVFDELLSFIIKPDGFEIPHTAARIHGITTAIAERDGRPLKHVLDWFRRDMQKVELVIAHNIDFDAKILIAEYIRTGMQHFFYNRNWFCTMKGTADFCNIPGPYGPKWPTLQELYGKLFHKKLDETHDALLDVQTCEECYFEYQKRLEKMKK